MNRLLTYSFLAAGLLVLGGCGTSAPQATADAALAAPLPPDQVKTLYAVPHREDGVVLEGTHAGKKWIKWVKPDGSQHLSAAHGLFTDDGRFIVDGDKVCSNWTQIDKGQTTCMHLSKVAPNTYVTIDPGGKEGSRFQVSVPGAPPDD